MEKMVLSLKKRYRIAVAWGQDVNSIAALNEAFKKGLIEPVLIGNPVEIFRICNSLNIDGDLYTVLDSPDEAQAAADAVKLVKSGKADIVMKGLVGTDKFLKAVMDKEKGLLLPGAVLTYVGALEIPAYHKLLFITDPAVIPYPTLEQKVAMARYAISMAQRFGIDKPKIALIGASEKISPHFPYSAEYAEMCRMAAEGLIENCIMDGPLDLFLACDPESVKIKGIATPLNGDADILLFPSLESSNPFYKSLMLFAGSKLSGLIRGTEKPVIVMSRSESELSKYYCIVLSCLMVN